MKPFVWGITKGAWLCSGIIMLASGSNTLIVIAGLLWIILGFATIEEIEILEKEKKVKQ